MPPKGSGKVKVQPCDPVVVVVATAPATAPAPAPKRRGRKPTSSLKDAAPVTHHAPPPAVRFDRQRRQVRAKECDTRVQAGQRRIEADEVPHKVGAL